MYHFQKNIQCNLDVSLLIQIKAAAINFHHSIFENRFDEIQQLFKIKQKDANCSLKRWKKERATIKIWHGGGGTNHKKHQKDDNRKKSDLQKNFPIMSCIFL